MRIPILVALLAVSSTLQANDADFYVSKFGNDTWSGKLAIPNADKSDGPLATPQQAINEAGKLRAAGHDKPITIAVRDGRYELIHPIRLTPDDSGTEELPLNIQAYPEETPVFSGGVEVKPIKEDGYWILPIPTVTTPVRSISVNGNLRLSSRWPKEGQFQISGLAGADPKANYRTPANKFEYAEGQISQAWNNWQDIEVVVLHFWVAGYYRIEDLDEQSKTVTLDRASIRRFTEAGDAAPGRFYLQNVSEKIDPGEFYHDMGRRIIKYKPTEGESLDDLVVVPKLESVLRMEGLPEQERFISHVMIDGITFSDTNFDIGPKVAADLQAAQNVTGAVHCTGIRSCQITNCRFENLGGYGLELANGCRNNRIERNEFHNLGAGGIRMNGTAADSPEPTRTGENLIADNHLHEMGRIFHAGVGILSQHADNNEILHNHIHDLDYTAISVGWVWGYNPSVSVGNKVENNLIHDVGRKILSDMGGIYMLGVSPGTVVRGNHMYNIESFNYGGWGVYTDEGSTDILIENNLVHHTKSGGFHQHYGKNNIVRNNIFALAKEGQIMRSRMEEHNSFTLSNNIIYADGTPLLAKNWKDDKFTLESNLYWDAANPKPDFPGGSFSDWQARGFDKGSILADPGFSDPAKGDFQLKPNSPAMKIGFKPFDYTKAGIRKPKQ